MPFFFPGERVGEFAQGDFDVLVDEGDFCVDLLGGFEGGEHFCAGADADFGAEFLFCPCAEAGEEVSFQADVAHVAESWCLLLWVEERVESFPVEFDGDDVWLFVKDGVFYFFEALGGDVGGADYFESFHNVFLV